MLGTLIVGTAIVFGIQQFHNHGVKAHQSALIIEMNDIWADVLAYRIKPVVLGDGGGSFDGYLPVNAGPFRTSRRAEGGAMFETDDACYYLEYFSNEAIRITASSKIYGDGARTGNQSNSRIVATFNKKQKLNKKGFQILGAW